MSGLVYHRRDRSYTCPKLWLSHPPNDFVTGLSQDTHQRIRDRESFLILRVKQPKHRLFKCRFFTIQKFFLKGTRSLEYISEKILLQSMMLFVFKLAIITKLLTTLWKITKLTMMSMMILMKTGDLDPGVDFVKEGFWMKERGNPFLSTTTPNLHFAHGIMQKDSSHSYFYKGPIVIRSGNNQQGSVCLSSCLSCHVFLSLL